MKIGFPARHDSHRLAGIPLMPYRKQETPLPVRFHAAVGRVIAGAGERVVRRLRRQAPRFG